MIAEAPGGVQWEGIKASGMILLEIAGIGKLKKGKLKAECHKRTRSTVSTSWSPIENFSHHAFQSSRDNIIKSLLCILHHRGKSMVVVIAQIFK